MQWLKVTISESCYTKLTTADLLVIFFLKNYQKPFFSKFSQAVTLYLTSTTMSSLRPAFSGVNLTINENSSIFPEILAFPLTATNSVVKPSSAAEPLLSHHCIQYFEIFESLFFACMFLPYLPKLQYDLFLFALHKGHR